MSRKELAQTVRGRILTWVRWSASGSVTAGPVRFGPVPAVEHERGDVRGGAGSGRERSARGAGGAFVLDHARDAGPAGEFVAALLRKAAEA
jgi:hypothetical protein